MQKKGEVLNLHDVLICNDTYVHSMLRIPKVVRQIHVK